MATVTLIGTVKNPDGTIPAGSLEFTLAAKTEDTGGNVNVPIPAAVSVAVDGSVSVTLEESQQYDVAAVLTGDRPSRITLGRWTCPPAGALAHPSLFDGWRGSQLVPENRLLCSIAPNAGAVKSPKRTSGDLATFTPASPPSTQPATGLRLAEGATLTVPGADNLLVTGGAVAVIFTPDGWSGGTATRHVFDTALAGLCRARCYTSAAGELILEITDHTGEVKTLRGTVSGRILAGVSCTIAAEWDAVGYLTLRVDGVDLLDLRGSGSGRLTAVPATIYIGSSNAGAQSIAAVVTRMRSYESYCQFVVGYRLCDGLWTFDGAYRFGGRA